MIESGNEIPISAVILPPPSWALVSKDILEIEELAFEGIGYSEDHLQTDFDNPDSTVVALLAEHTRRLVGYSYAKRVDIETAHIDSTAIHPQFQGQGLLKKMMPLLDQALREKGFKFVTRRARVANGYADGLLRIYGDRVMETSDLTTKYGPQKYIKYRL